MIFATEQTATVGADKPVPTRLAQLGSALAAASRYVSGVITAGISRIEANIVPVCICAAIMFPAYWFIWKYLFPQPYENLWLRLIGSLLCLIIAAKDWWPRSWRRYLPVIWLGTALYGGPFFFTFMLLQNGTSMVWLMSTLVGLFLVVLLLDWISLIALFVAGSVLAWWVHLMVSPSIMSVNLYVEFVPIFLFALIAGTIFNYKAAGLREAKERARLEVGALLAKEMQSPLFSIRTNAASLSKLLPALIGSYTEAPRRRNAPALPAQQLGALERVPARIEQAVEQMNGMIETLMTEGGQPGAGRQWASSMQRCLDAAMAQLPLTAELDRARIIVERQHEFLFHASPVLMAHVLARVLEASLNEIYNETGAELVVSLGQDGAWNYLRLTDSSAELRSTGATGLLRFRLSRNGKDFSRRPDLALANLVLERIGGTVTRTVAFGRTAETVLWFPQPGP